MSVFIELTTDAFEENLLRQREKYVPGERAGLTNVRRPLRGIEIKEDTYAMIKVIRADGKELYLADQSHPDGRRRKTASFILQQVQEARMEKHQIVETFGDPYIFFFGESPRFLDCQAILINSHDFNWRAEWWANWELRMRGTKTVELGARTYLFYDDNIVEGYMLMAQAVEVSDQPFIVQLTWRMFVTGHKNVTFVGDPNYPVHASVNLPPDVSLTDADAFDKLIHAYQTEARAQQQLSDYNNLVSGLSEPIFGRTGRLTDLLRYTSRSVAFPPEVQAFVDGLRSSNLQDLPELDLIDQLTRRPLRGKIADNLDEFTGTSTIAPDFRDGLLPEAINPSIRGAQEVQDLFYAAINWMACLGANINSYDALSGLGMGASFGATGGVGIGLGSGVGASYGGGATFGAVAGAGGFSGFEGSYSANGFGTVGSAGGFVASGQAQADPFFGAAAGGAAGVSATAGFTASASGGGGLDLGFGDQVYGYASPFGGPGFGHSGYGDFGGLGFGSAFGPGGDPGYLAPDKFTWAGVDDDRGAFERFIAPPPGYGSGFGGVGASASFAGMGAKASVHVGGSISAFSMSVVEGSLGQPLNAGLSPFDPNFDPSLNPFGVSCLGTLSTIGGVQAGAFAAYSASGTAGVGAFEANASVVASGSASAIGNLL